MRSGLDAEATRQRIIAKMTEVADVLESTAWRIPAVPPFDFRGTLAEPGWDGAPRLLFLQKAMHTLTGDGKWARHYEQSLHGKDGPRRKSDLTRLQSCEAGVASRPRPQMWTGSVSNACLRELWELERDETVRGFYTRGLQASAAFASTQLAPALEFDHDSAKPYDGDWRKLNDLWRPQKTSGEASDVSEPQRSRKNKLSPRFGEEARLMREPCFAAWIITLCPDREVIAKHRAAILQTLTHYRFDRLHLSGFFPLESAGWRLQVAG